MEKNIKSVRDKKFTKKLTEAREEARITKKMIIWYYENLEMITFSDGYTEVKKK